MLFILHKNCASILYRFWDSELHVESRNFFPPHVSLVLPFGVIPSEFQLEAKDILLNTNTARRLPKRPKNGVLSLVTLTFNLWPWPSNSSERGTKHVFPVILAQIRSAVPETFHTQTKEVRDSAKNRTYRSSLRAITRRLASENHSP